MMDQIKTLLNEGVEKGHFPGAQYCLIDGPKIQCDYVGYKRTYPDRVPNNGTEIYDIASLTKVVVTTTLVLKMIEDNLISLNSRISRYLPLFKHDEITVYHLLTHTSGLQADIHNAKAYKNKHEIFNTIYMLDLTCPPQTRIIYSDVNFLLLGEVVEMVYKDTLENLARDKIFKPLAMEDSSFRPNRFLTAPTEYRDDSVYRGLLNGLVHDEKSFALKGISGHAGCFSTAYDLALFMQNLIRPKKVLSKEMVNLLFKKQVSNNLIDDKEVTRSLGYIKPTKGSFAGNNFSQDDTIMHTGFTGCHMVIDRKQKKGFVLLSNAVHPKRENNKIMAYRKSIGSIVFD